ncbi:df6edaa9-c4aa-4e1f-834f-eb0036d79081 [Thermothielavioides terrestris]|uniref:Df6edaa9-c4aa-4e1f-834f-eb0036d79081 n=1 Tax=Thermothielavioides terrestris TaxID=2587410 RepID=A0A446B9E7_9PEZI|nr:df6edaa9-c4aa-4e1f-834f-eb0036d79081 [Thermothielavioides terrestris]
MPRQGDGSADNAIEAGHNIIHGAGVTTRVSRADKTAPMPEYEKGAGLGKVGASGGRSEGKDQGGRSRTN